MKNLILLTTLLFTSLLSAQDPITIHNGCNFEGDENETEYYSFDPSNEATQIVRKILDGAGSLSYNSFIIKESNVQNAVATEFNHQRFILYSTVFLEKFKGDAKTKWAAYTVLAHEIGHHLNNHDFGEKDPKKRKSMELEADKFAGAVCRTLGASLEESLAGIESMKLEGETATHPAKSARRAAVANGWKKQAELIGTNEPTSTLTPAEKEIPIKKVVLSADDCPNCQGVGTTPKKEKCQICDASGMVWVTEKCSKCEGKGKDSQASCFQCKGRGTEVCGFCDGTGIWFKKTCTQCKGNGNEKGAAKPNPCTFCDSTGKAGCKTCNAKGTIRKVKVACTACAGTGRVDIREKCSLCKGSGKKKKP